MCRLTRTLILALVLLLTGAATWAEAAPPHVYYPTTPRYYSGGRITPGVYVYPQVRTTPLYPARPYYGLAYPWGWGGSYYPVPYYYAAGVYWSGFSPWDSYSLYYSTGPSYVYPYGP
jgi:hypothetical protein